MARRRASLPTLNPKQNPKQNWVSFILSTA